MCMQVYVQVCKTHRPDSLYTHNTLRLRLLAHQMRRRMGVILHSRILWWRACSRSRVLIASVTATIECTAARRLILAGRLLAVHVLSDLLEVGAILVVLQRSCNGLWDWRRCRQMCALCSETYKTFIYCLVFGCARHLSVFYVNVIMVVVIHIFSWRLYVLFEREHVINWRATCWCLCSIMVPWRLVVLSKMSFTNYNPMVYNEFLQLATNMCVFRQIKRLEQNHAEPAAAEVSGTSRATQTVGCIVKSTDHWRYTMYTITFPPYVVCMCQNIVLAIGRMRCAIGTE